MRPAAHPLVGTWLLTFPDEPGAGPSLNAYTADGLAFQANPGRHGQGAWAATGERTAAMTLVLLIEEGGVVRGTVRVRAGLEVDATGDALAGTFTTEFVGADGASTGQRGPLAVAGERIRAEPPSAVATPATTAG
jgi:hypothetical protein